MTNLLLMTGPAEEPVTIAEARAFLRIDGDHDDAVVAACIVAARQACESFTRRALMTQVWQLYLDDWPADGGPVTLPRPPLQAVTMVSVHDADGTATELDADDFWIDSARSPARLVPRVAL